MIPSTERTDAPVRARSSQAARKYSQTFPAHAEQVPQARAFLSRALAGCRLASDAVLICSELATNAVLHSDSARPGGKFTVRAEVREGDYVWIEVEDQGGRWTEEKNEEGGRGLEIVTVLADYWGIEGDETTRVVCARLDWPIVMRDGT